MALLSCVSDSELLRYQRIARPVRKKQFLVGRLLLRHSLAHLLKMNPRNIALIERERQAPLLHIAVGNALPYFSISHSANWVACACSASVTLGLDIEHYDVRRNLEAISQHTFQPDEVAWLNKQPDRVAAFYMLWSRKEARFKLTQSYVKAEIEHCYELSHPAMSAVLMTGRSLDTTPVFESMSWDALKFAFE